MKRVLPLIFLAMAPAAFAVDIPVQRVADDAKVIDRVAEASKRDLPQDLLKRIVNEDLEALRGKRADGTYENASYERLESSRSDASYSVEAKKDDAALQHFEIKGAFVYRLLVDLPSRRMLVTRNRRVYLDHVEFEYIPMSSSDTRRQSVNVAAWVEPGEEKSIELPEVARQATARVFAKADEKEGYGNIVLILIAAKVVDNADSPYADAVSSAKAMIRAIDNADIPSIRAMAARVHSDLAARLGTPATQTVDVVASVPLAPVVTSPATSTPSPDVYSDLQSIEDLLTGNEAEKRQGLDRLHQLIRRIRPR
ncbi:MAG TPA: hypothetical protein VF980_16090 [Thermoanaerobaculia bacterium]